MKTIKNAIGPPLVPYDRKNTRAKSRRKTCEQIIALSYREHYTAKGLLMAELYEDVEKVWSFFPQNMLYL